MLLRGRHSLTRVEENTLEVEYTSNNWEESGVYNFKEKIFPNCEYGKRHQPPYENSAQLRTWFQLVRSCTQHGSGMSGNTHTKAERIDENCLVNFKQ